MSSFFLGRGLDRYKDSFNYWLSHSRQTIEHAFGILMQHWGIFLEVFHFFLSQMGHGYHGLYEAS